MTLVHLFVNSFSLIQVPALNTSSYGYTCFFISSSVYTRSLLLVIEREKYGKLLSQSPHSLYFSGANVGEEAIEK